MTRRIQWVIGDDLVAHASKGKEHVDADETLVIAIGPDLQHLKIRELDLTAGHASELHAVLKPYLDAGHPPGEQPELPPVPVPGALTDHPGQGRRREIPGTRKFLQELRYFAAASGHPVPQTSGKTGKVNYKPLPGQYASFVAHLRRQAAAGDMEAAVLLDIARRLKPDLPEPQDTGLPAAGNGQAGAVPAR